MKAFRVRKAKAKICKLIHFSRAVSPAYPAPRQAIPSAASMVWLTDPANLGQALSYIRFRAGLEYKIDIMQMTIVQVS